MYCTMGVSLEKVVTHLLFSEVGEEWKRRFLFVFVKPSTLGHGSGRRIRSKAAFPPWTAKDVTLE